MKKCKSLFRGDFNLHNELKTVYSFAYTAEQAKIVMARRIAKQQEVLPVVVLGWLKSHPNSWEIKIEQEAKPDWRCLFGGLVGIIVTFLYLIFVVIEKLHK